MKAKDGSIWQRIDGHDDKDYIIRNHLIVTPNDEQLRKEIMRLNHDTPIAGHPGRLKTLELVQQNYWWPRMRKDINMYVDGCSLCQKTKIFPQKPIGVLKPLELPTGPWQTIGVDLITGLPMSQGHNAIMTVVDHFTGKPYFLPCSNTLTARGSTKAFRDSVWSHEGFPEKVVSDRGPQFAADFTKELNRLLGIKTALSSAYHPQTDGLSERMNQEIEQYLRLFINYHQDDWVEWLPMAMFAFACRKRTSTGYSPFFLDRGREPNREVGVTKTSHNRDARMFALEMKKVRLEAEVALRAAQESTKRFYDRKRQNITYEKGEEVLLDARDIVTGRPKKKLDHRRLGPYPIVQKHSVNSYELKLPRAFKIHPVFHASKLSRPAPDVFE